MDAVKVWGDASSDNVVVFWGSTKGAVLEAAKHFTKPAKLLQIVCVEPMDEKKVLEHLKDAKTVIDVELNATAQLASLIREKTGIEITKKVLKYDGRPFAPLELASQINGLLA